MNDTRVSACSTPTLSTRAPGGKAAISSLGIAVAGWAACALAWRNDPVRFSAAYLVGFAFFLTIALGSLFFVMLAHLTGSAWSVTMRRIAENVMFTIPAGAVLFLPVAFCLGSLYEWARPEAVAADPLLRGKAAFLNPRIFLRARGGLFRALEFLGRSASIGSPRHKTKRLIA